ncbi:hypothetical protein E2C01_053816 [Portunus trituberculatus]|uniref:Uncharacterized protein n=1 Tax=Portunus trituberculatus TaxID=210409 RepID=A0A5B7GRU5_PORTR|nr:hypothetical protein [Portunus trituberculatus]
MTDASQLSARHDTRNHSEKSWLLVCNVVSLNTSRHNHRGGWCASTRTRNPATSCIWRALHLIRLRKCGYRFHALLITCAVREKGREGEREERGLGRGREVESKRKPAMGTLGFLLGMSRPSGPPGGVGGRGAAWGRGGVRYGPPHPAAHWCSGHR